MAGLKLQKLNIRAPSEFAPVVLPVPRLRSAQGLNGAPWRRRRHAMEWTGKPSARRCAPTPESFRDIVAPVERRREDLGAKGVLLREPDTTQISLVVSIHAATGCTEWNTS
jgi:hypothetical protein